MICSAWACKHTYTIEYFVGLCTHSNVWKVSSVNTGEWVTTGGLYRPTHLCVAHFVVHKRVCTEKSFFCYVVRLGGVWGDAWGLWRSMFQEVGGLYGVSERGGGIWVQGSHSLGEITKCFVDTHQKWFLLKCPQGCPWPTWKKTWQ